MAGERVVIGGLMVLDANVVFPIAVADFLLTASTHGLLVPVLSPTILDEARRNMIANLRLDADRVDWRLSRCGPSSVERTSSRARWTTPTVS